MYFLYKNEYRNFKPVEVTIRRGKMIEGVNSTMIYCKNFYKHHNVPTPVQQKNQELSTDT
jgi:hypothetical protein